MEKTTKVRDDSPEARQTRALDALLLILNYSQLPLGDRLRIFDNAQAVLARRAQ